MNTRKKEEILNVPEKVVWLENVIFTLRDNTKVKGRVFAPNKQRNSIVQTIQSIKNTNPSMKFSIRKIKDTDFFCITRLK